MVIISTVSYEIGSRQQEDSFMKYLKQSKPRRIKDQEFKYISPLIGVNAPNVFELGYYKNTQEKIQNIVDEYEAKGLVDYAIYYRNLNVNVSFGINEKKLFSPASLLKIPIALAAYKQEESNPGFLNTQVTFTEQMADNAKKRQDSNSKFTVGQKYVLRDVIEEMLVYSDNDARDLVISSLSMTYIYELYRYLQLKNPDYDTTFKLSVEEYSLFFRMLYSSTFISEKHSEELLNILTKTTFDYGIKQGLPQDKDIVAAHKFGVYNAPTGPTGVALQSLHDCGIVYDANDAYLLCVMTTGPDQNILAQFIADISKAAYEFTQKDIY